MRLREELKVLVGDGRIVVVPLMEVMILVVRLEEAIALAVLGTVVGK
jgi:hypothetical protein